MLFKTITGKFLSMIVGKKDALIIAYQKSKFASFGTGSEIGPNCIFTESTIYVGNNSHIGPNCLIRSAHGKIHIGNHVMISPGVHIHGGNHPIDTKGVFLDEVEKEFGVDGDLIIEDDAWIGANSILLKGSNIGRGSVIGAGSLVRHTIPPYAVVSGNPCKVIGFRFTPAEIIDHERLLYDKSERLPLELLEKNYEKFFINRIKDIKQFTKL